MTARLFVFLSLSACS